MGTEEFWVPLAISALAGGGEAYNQSAANSREQNAEVQALQNQQRLQQQGASQVNKLTQQIARDTPQSIQAKATGDFVSQLRRNAAGSTQGGSTSGNSTTYGAPVSALAPSVGANARYGADTAASQKQVEDFGNTEAGQMGAIDAATRQRQMEGLGMQTLGTNLNTLGAQSFSQNFVDQLRAQAAGQTNPWVTLGSNLAGNLATYGSKNWGSGTSANGMTTNSGGYKPIPDNPFG